MGEERGDRVLVGEGVSTEAVSRPCQGRRSELVGEVVYSERVC